MPTVKTLIRLGGCPGWSELSLGAQIIFVGFVMLRLSCETLEDTARCYSFVDKSEYAEEMALLSLLVNYVLH